MTAQIPDPKTLESWEDAFQHPLPVVRKLEQQLRKSIDENRQKLRSLVGTSYRDLLATAERIIEMDEQIQTAETHMSEIGRKCNARTLEKIGVNHARMKRARGGREEGEEKYRVAAQTKVLQSAVTATGRIVRGGGDALLASKLLVLARLLHKSLADTSPVVEDLRRKLGQARKRVLAYISRSLAKTNLDKTVTIHTLCAYSLITSSAPKDVLRYFLQVRFEQLEAKVEMPSEGNLLETLDLYSQTLLETREVFPRRFAESLSQLAKGALVRDPDVRALVELSLDIYEQWIPDDVRNFHPWVRHDQLLASEVGEALASWTKQAQACLLQGLTDALKEQNDAHAVLDLRQKVLSKYLSLSAKLRSDVHTQAIDDLRKTFLTRLEEIAAQTSSMPTFDLDAQSNDDSTPGSLWELATDDVDLNDGATHFRKAVIQRHRGQSKAIRKVTAALDEWIERLQKFAGVVASMRSTKWDDDLDLELEDLATDESLQDVLSKQDPQQLQARLRQETIAALQDSYRRLESSSESEANATVFIRILREVDQRRRGLEGMLEKTDTVKAEQGFTAALHRQIGASISGDPIQELLQRMRLHSRIPVTLWDGSPALPIQPSPVVFRFLKALHGKMSEAGSDLWSPDAVQALKLVLTERLHADLANEVIDNAKRSRLTNGDADSQSVDHTEAKENKPEGEADGRAADSGHDQLVQQTFDVLYLQRAFAFGTKNTESSKLSRSAEEMGQLSGMDGSAMDRLRKSANEYWKRTYLLFGLLAAERSS